MNIGAVFAHSFMGGRQTVGTYCRNLHKYSDRLFYWKRPTIHSDIGRDCLQTY